jgi:hypothetical protein
MRARAAAILLALLAAGGLSAAKPVPPADSPADIAADTRARSRGQGISYCVGELRAVPGLGPEDLESICGCAVDRLPQSARDTALPGGEPQAFQRGLRGPLLSCTARFRPERVSDVARLTISAAAAPAPVQPPTPLDGKPLDDNEVLVEGEKASGESSGGGFRAWLRTLAWPAWLTGASVLWWVAVGIFLFGLLILKIRRRDPRNDLVAPPGHMRRGAPPQPPRRPDLPR